MKIKKLKWKKVSLKDQSGGYLMSTPMGATVECDYCIDLDFPITNKYMTTFFNNHDEKYLGTYKTVEKAKEKCQAHFNKLIGKCLE